MSDAKDGARCEVRPDEVIGRVVPDPSNPDVKSLAGVFLGESSRPGYWRLYTSVGLNQYCEFRKDDTLGAERFSSGRIVVWVKPVTRVSVMTATSAPVEFLQGAIASRNLRGRSIAQMIGGGGCGCGSGDPPPNTAPQNTYPCCNNPITIDPGDPICGGGGGPA